MATKTFEELKQLAIQIRDEKTNKQNTATRIGTQMLEHLDKLEQDYYDKTATDEELQARDEKLTELNQSVSDVYGFGMNEKKYISSTNGNILPYIDNNWACLEKEIECKEGDTFRVNLNGNGDSRVLVFAAYDENSQYLPDKSINGADWDDRKEIVIPDGVKFCNFCSYAINFGYFARPKNDIKSSVEENEALISSITNETEYDTNNIGFIDENGSLISDNNWRSSDIITCKYGDCFLIDLPCNNNLVCTISYYRNSVIDKELSVMGNSFKNYIIKVIDKTINGIRFSGGSYEYIGKKISIKKIEVYTPEINNRIDDLESHKAYYPIVTKKGYISPDGTDGSDIDSNWIKTDFLLTSNFDKVFLNLKGTLQIGTVCYYDSEKNFLPDLSIAGVDKVFLNEEYAINKSGFYVRICGKSSDFGNYTYKIDEISNYVEDIREIRDVIPAKKDYDMVFPNTIYLTCNDIGDNIPYKRNISPCLYLDHFFNGITNEIEACFNENKSVFLPFTFEVTTNSSWNSEVNGSVNTKITKQNVVISGNGINEKEFNLNVISTLASKSKNEKAFVLCIGDSITWGEGATNLVIGTTNDRKPYHCLCLELFKKDNVDDSGGYECVMLGTQKINSSFNYNERNYTYMSCHEGYRGYTMTQFLNGSVESFKSDAGKFSINAWLQKYRTLDDNGTRLSVGSGTGTLINSGNINDINCCTPTHIVIALGANEGVTLEQYQEMIDIIKQEVPNAKIAIAVPDSAGTIFPSKYQCVKNDISWNADSYIDNRHNLLFGCQKIVMQNFDNEEKRGENIFALPFFFTFNPLSFSYRECNFPDYEFDNSNANKEPYGWLPATHVSVLAHANWAYQLYSWIKYTLTVEIVE